MAQQWAACTAAGIVLYRFKGGGKFQLELLPGDHVRVEEKYGSGRNKWFKGYVLQEDGSKGPVGVFPASYVRVRSRGKGQKQEVDDHILFALHNALMEWSSLLRTYYRERNIPAYKEVKDRLYTLLNWERRICDPDVPLNVREVLKGQVIDKIDRGRRAMKLDIILRNAKGDVLTHHDTPIALLFNEFLLASNAPGGGGGGGGGLRASHQAKSAKSSLAHTFMLLQRRATVSHNNRQGKKLSQRTGSLQTGKAILLQFHSAILSVGEPIELHFALCKEGAYVSETWLVELTKAGMPEDLDLIGNLKTLFVDLPAAPNVLDDLWLVCHVVRQGALHLDKKSRATCRRPVAVCVQKLSPQVLKTTTLVDISMDCFVPPAESQWGTFDEALMHGDTSGYSVVPKSSGLKCSLRLFDVPSTSAPAVAANAAGALETDMPGLQLLLKEHADLLADAPLTKWIALRPGVRVNELHVVLEGGEGLGLDKNVEVEVRVLRNNGQPTEGAIFVGKKQQSAWCSSVLLRSGNPCWRERFRVRMDSLIPLQTALVLDLKHVTKLKSSTFAQAFLVLGKEDGTAIDDKKHTLQIFKPLKRSADLFFPNTKLQYRKGECVTLRTRLLSTVLTQHVAMLSLLEWKSHPERLHEVLKRFLYVELSEVAKFFTETFDALFSILEAEPDSAELVFQCLVHAIAVPADERSKYAATFRSRLEQYCQEDFCSKRAHELLTRVMLSSLSEPLRATKKVMLLFKSLSYVLAFVQRSKELDLGHAPSPQELSELRGELLKFFEAVCDLLNDTKLALLSVQATIYKNFNSWRNRLKYFFQPLDMANIVAKLLAAMPWEAERAQSKKSLMGAKLNLMYSLVSQEPIFVDEGARPVFLSAIQRQLEQHLAAPDNSELDFVRVLLSGVMQSVQQHLQVLPDEMLDFLSIVLQLLERSTAPTAVMESFTIFLSFLYLITSEQLGRLLMAGRSPDAARRLLSKLIELLRHYTEKPCYEASWFSLIMFQFSATRRFLTNVMQLLEKMLTSDSVDLLISFVNLCMAFISAPQLDLSAFPLTKQLLIEEAYGDLRLDAVAVLKEALRAVGNIDAELINQLVSSFLSLILIKQPEIEKLGINLYFATLKQEWKRTGAFEDVRARTINVLGQPRAANEAFADTLIRALERKFAGVPEMGQAGAEFLRFIRNFTRVVISLRTLPPTPNYDMERTMAFLQLLGFVRASEKTSFSTYVVQLAAQHIKASQYAEAAFVLCLLADELPWSTTERVPELKWLVNTYPSESCFDRKRRILREAADYLEKDSQFESALQLLQRLRLQYEERHMYHARGKVLQKMSAIYKALAGEERLLPEYFRVAFYGRGFGPLAGATYVFRGALLERLDEFNARWTDKYPGVEILSYTSEPPKEVLESAGRYLQIFRVLPASPEQLEGRDVVEEARLPAAHRKFRSYNEVSVFMYEKPVKKGSSGNEIADLWVRLSFYEVEMPLPGIARFTRIIKQHTRELTPMQYAVKTMQTKNKDLAEMIAAYADGKTHDNTQPFISMVQGVVDAAVGGGFRTYSEQFLSEEYLATQENGEQLAQQLVSLYRDQIRLMRKGLDLWPKICAASFAPLLAHLEKSYATIVEEADRNFGD